MDVLEQKTRRELIQSLLAEIAKTKNEIKCAQADLTKATNRLGFSLLVLNKLINREEDKQQ
jgi:hypothetical protein